MPTKSLLSVNFEMKTDPSNLKMFNHMTEVSEGNQKITAKISASVCLTFKITTGFFFYRSIFYRVSRVSISIFVKISKLLK